MHGSQFFRAAVEQVHRQDGAQDQDIGQFGLRIERQTQERHMGDVFPEEGRRDGQPDDVIPSHHDQRAQFFELRLDDHRIDGDGHHGDEHEQVALRPAAVGERESVAEKQDGGPDQRADDTHDAGPDVFVRVHQVVHDEREGRAQRGDDRGVDRRGVGRAPEQHIHPPVDDQQRDNQDVAGVAPRDAERLLREECEGDEEDRRREHLKHEDLLEVEVIARERNVKREIRPEKDVSEDQIEIIARFTHERTILQLSHHPPKRRVLGAAAGITGRSLTRASTLLKNGS